MLQGLMGRIQLRKRAPFALAKVSLCLIVLLLLAGKIVLRLGPEVELVCPKPGLLLLDRHG